ncbi:MAG: sigma factor [Christensenellales bacterium]
MSPFTEDEREQRLRHLMEVYGDGLKRLCCVYLRDMGLAEDAVQETFIKAYDHIDELLSGKIESTKAWLMRIAVNTCKDTLRSSWMRHIDNRQEIEALPLSIASCAEERLALTQAIMALAQAPKSCCCIIIGYEPARLCAVLNIRADRHQAARDAKTRIQLEEGAELDEKATAKPSTSLCSVASARRMSAPCSRRSRPRASQKRVRRLISPLRWGCSCCRRARHRLHAAQSPSGHDGYRRTRQRSHSLPGCDGRRNGQRPARRHAAPRADRAGSPAGRARLLRIRLRHERLFLRRVRRLLRAAGRRLFRADDQHLRQRLHILRDRGRAHRRNSPLPIDQPRPLPTPVSAEAKTWTQKFGSNLFSWSAADQAEYARRYKGATLREPRGGEIPFEQAAQIASQAAKAVFEANGLSADAPLCYPMLYAERADENGAAHYRVFCFAAPPAEPATHETYVLVTLNPATGSVESTEFALDSHSPLMDGDIR